MKYKKGLVSIVVPTYNDQRYLSASLNDLLQQTYNNIEIIIVNDGSTDNTDFVIKEYAAKDSRIIETEKSNGGTGSALNYGYQFVTGEYSTWCSSDDRKSLRYIERLVKILKFANAEYVISAYYSEHLNSAWRAYVPKYDGMPIPSISGGWKHGNTTSGMSFEVTDWPQLNYTMCHSGVSFLYTMELKNRCGDFLEIPGEDYYMSVKMGILSKKTMYLDEILGKHCCPPDSLTSSEGVRVTHEAERLTKEMIRNWLTLKT